MGEGTTAAEEGRQQQQSKQIFSVTNRKLDIGSKNKLETNVNIWQEKINFESGEI